VGVMDRAPLSHSGMNRMSGLPVRHGASLPQCPVFGDRRISNSPQLLPAAWVPSLALLLLLMGFAMTDSNQSPPRKKTDRPVLMPVTKLVSRPAVTIVNGQLSAVKVLVDRKAA
jgi:hypothetical protein